MSNLGPIHPPSIGMLFLPNFCINIIFEASSGKGDWSQHFSNGQQKYDSRLVASFFGRGGGATDSKLVVGKISLPDGL